MRAPCTRARRLASWDACVRVGCWVLLGGVLIGGAKLLNTVEIGNCLVHEMDGLCNPKALFRFLDVLRIPGSS